MAKASGAAGLKSTSAQILTPSDPGGETGRLISATPRPAGQAYLTERELAARWGISPKTLQNRRVAGGSIPFFKFGSAVRYALSDVEAYEAQARRASTSDTGGDDE